MRLTPSEALALAQAADRQTIARPVRRRLQKLELLDHKSALPTGKGLYVLEELSALKRETERQAERARRAEEVRQPNLAQPAPSKLILPAVAMAMLAAASINPTRR